MRSHGLWCKLSMLTRGIGRRVSSLVHRPIQRLEFIGSPSSIVLALQISAKRKLSPPCSLLPGQLGSPFGPAVLTIIQWPKPLWPANFSLQRRCGVNAKLALYDAGWLSNCVQTTILARASIFQFQVQEGLVGSYGLASESNSW